MPCSKHACWRAMPKSQRCKEEKNYPTALRAIPATVPTAFCVLRSVLWGASQTTTQTHAKMHQTNKQKVHQISIKNRQQIDQQSLKIEVWRGPGRASGRSGEHSLDQGCPKGARNQKSDEKFAQPPWIPQSLGSPKSSILEIFAIFVDFFCGRFSEARFGDLRPPILEDFGMIF